MASDKSCGMKDTVLALSALFNALPDAMLVVDGQGRIVFANAAVSGILGYTADELTGKSLGCLIPERQRSVHASHFTQFH